MISDAFFEVLAFVPARTVLLPLVAGGYITSIGCRLAPSRHRRVRWLSIVLASLGAAALTVSFVGLGFALQPGEFPYVDELELLPCVFVIAASVALAPALIVASFYRRSPRNV